MRTVPKLKPKSIPEERIASTEQTLASSQETVERFLPADIAPLAYSLWQQRSCPARSAEIDWLEAEQQLSR